MASRSRAPPTAEGKFDAVVGHADKVELSKHEASALQFGIPIGPKTKTTIRLLPPQYRCLLLVEESGGNSVSGIDAPVRMPPRKPPSPDHNANITMIPVGILDDSLATRRNGTPGKTAYLRLMPKEQRFGYADSNGRTVSADDIWFFRRLSASQKATMAVQRTEQLKAWEKREWTRYWNNLKEWEVRRIVWEATIVYELACQGAGVHWSHLADPGRIISIGIIGIIKRTIAIRSNLWAIREGLPPIHTEEEELKRWIEMTKEDKARKEMEKQSLAKELLDFIASEELRLKEQKAAEEKEAQRRAQEERMVEIAARIQELQGELREVMEMHQAMFQG